MTATMNNSSSDGYKREDKDPKKIKTPMGDTNTEELYSLEKKHQKHLNKSNLKNKMLEYYCEKGKEKRGLGLNSTDAKEHQRTVLPKSLAEEIDKEIIGEYSLSTMEKQKKKTDKQLEQQKKELEAQQRRKKEEFKAQQRKEQEKFEAQQRLIEDLFNKTTLRK